MNTYFTTLLKLALHYAISFINYGLFTIPIVLIVVFTLTGLVSHQAGEAFLQNTLAPLIMIEEKGLMPMVSTVFLTIATIIKFFFKTKIETWVTGHFKIIILAITIIFAFNYLSLISAANASNDTGFVVALFYAITMGLTIFALISTKIALIIHQLIDSFTPREL